VSWNLEGREAFDLAPLVGVRVEERARAVGDIFEVATILDATLLPSGKHTRNLWNISFF